MSETTPSSELMLGPRFSDALDYATRLHAEDTRKASEGEEATIPYIGHLLAVAGEVIDAGGTEDEAVAALLHDAAEDRGGEEQLEKIEELFGAEVAQIVRDCSDSLVTDPAQKEDWELRKRRYIEHVRKNVDGPAMRVSIADKLHNVRAILRDHGQIGERVWSRFSRDKAYALGYHVALRDAYRDRAEELGIELPLLTPYDRAIDELAEIVGVPPADLGPPPV